MTATRVTMADAAKRRERVLRMSATMSLSQIAKRLGVSRQRIHQMIVKQRAVNAAEKKTDPVE